MRLALSLPLLTKELTEAAARRRTYVLRVVYGVLLYGFFALSVPGFFRVDPKNTLAMLGVGRDLLEVLFHFQLFAIGVFLPALMCGRITEEKERDSLVLLFLTELSPWQIVLQKYLGGLVPMFTFLLLAMPLGAVAYAFGGLGQQDIVATVWILTLTCLQVGALALACSAWCRTTVGAFVGTYLLGLLLIGGSSILMAVVWDHFLQVDFRLRWGGRTLDFYPLNPILVFENIRRSPPAGMFAKSSGLLISIPVLLLVARIGLVRRAFVPPGNLLRRVFRWLDAVMQRGNRLVGNVMVARSGSGLPEDDPIAWREQHRSGLGQPHHLVRILLAMAIPIGFVCFLTALDTRFQASQDEEISFVFGMVAIVVVLILCVHSANAFVSERVQQSLDVLLTTPMSAARIVAQKARALRRFTWVLAVPLLMITGTELWLEWDALRAWPAHYPVPNDGRAAYAACVLLTVLIYLPLFSWLSLWIGLRARTRFKAIATAVGVVVGWCVGPIALVIVALHSVSRLNPDETWEWLVLLSPVGLPLFNEVSGIHEIGVGMHSPWPILIGNFLFYFAWLQVFRGLALARADRYLRR